MNTPITAVSLSIGHTPNYATVTVGTLTLHFSYSTVIAFDAGHGTVVRQNAWGPTTGKHLNAIDGGDKLAKSYRVDGEEFERLLAGALAPSTTPEEIAEQVLRNHVMQEHWVRATPTIREYLIEAVKAARA